MKKLTTVFLIIVLVLLVGNIQTFATGVTAELVGNSKLESTESQVVEIKISDSSDEVGSIGGTISTTNIIVEKVEGINGFQWTDYNPSNGKFTSVKPDGDVKGTSVIRITYKLNDGKTSGTIQVSNIKAANSVDYMEVDVAGVSKSVELDSQPDPEDPENPDPENPDPENPDPQNKKIVNITTESGKNTITPGQKTKIIVKTSTGETVNNEDLIFTSSDVTIATVDKNGNVTGLKEGSVKITVSTKDGTETNTYTLNVSASNPSGGNNSSGEEGGKSTGGDSTTAKGKMPQTGEKSIIGISIIAVIGLVAFLAKKNKDLKDIK